MSITRPSQENNSLNNNSDIMVFNVTTNVEDNREGWGPCEVPNKFTSVPFLPYGKGERLGRIAEFGYSNIRNSRMGHYNSTLMGILSIEALQPTHGPWSLWR